jgi:hypothetical protein
MVQFDPAIFTYWLNTIHGSEDRIAGDKVEILSAIKPIKDKGVNSRVWA